MANEYVRIRSGAPFVPNDVIIPHKLTFSYLVHTIQDELADEPNNYEEQVQRCIFNAIRFCEREPHYFNEERNATFNTRAGVGVYSSEDSMFISNSARISAVYVDWGGFTSKLERRNLADSQAGEVGQPIAYDYYNRKLIIYPSPNDVYTIRLTVHPVRLDEIENVDDYHPWLVEGFDLIRARAKYEFYKNIVHDYERAEVAYGDYQEQLAALRAEDHRRANAYKLIPTEY